MFVPEESPDVLMETVNGRGSLHSPWLVAKRGTIFREAELPSDGNIDWFRDVTHVYRVKNSGRKRGRREWGTTLWVDGMTAQRQLTHKKVRYPFSLI